MRIRRPRSLPILWQTLLLLLASLACVQLISVALIIAYPPPRPEFMRLNDIADALAGRVTEFSREHPLQLKHDATPPPQVPGWTANPAFEMRLAELLGTSPGKVRFWYEPDQRVRSLSHRYDRGPSRDRGPDNGLVPRRHGEPIFVNGFIAGFDTGHGWSVVINPASPFIANWQRRMILWFGISMLVLIPFAWVFTRKLTRPIRHFAEAADRLGTDPQAPLVPEEGPAELRTTAVALNRMQTRIADHMAERTAMIGAIAHDLRTPLARIAFRIEGAPEVIRHKVQADIEQMQAMITDTISFVRGAGQEGQFRPVDLIALIKTMAAEERETGHDVIVRSFGDAVVSGDPGSLRRVFQNLIDNAVAYGVRAKVTIDRRGEEIIVCVADEGPGLSEAEMSRVMLPFERGDPSRNRQTGGTGLGLSIAQAILKRHGGHLMLRNGQESGLRAICTLPGGVG